VLSSGRPAIRLARQWRAPLSLGLGVPLLLGSSPAAAAGAGGVVVGGVTTWLGMFAALLALLAPRRPGDVAGAAAVVVVAALFFVVFARRRQREHAQRARAVRLGGRSRHRGVAVRRRAPRRVVVGIGERRRGARSRAIALPSPAGGLGRGRRADARPPDHARHAAGAAAGARHRLGGPSRTDVITLHATLLDVEELGAAWLASVEFSGLIRESAEQGAVPFRELWMLAAAKDGAPSWRLARQQALL
jgi:hypothetical protein